MIRADGHQLLEQIEQNFRFTRAPEPHEIVDEKPCDIERQTIKAAFSGKPWSALPADMLLQRAEALFFFTPKAWRYYVPAFLRVILLHFNDAAIVVEMLLGSLTRYRSEYLPQLNTAQRETIVDVLSWLSYRLHDRPGERQEVKDLLRSFSVASHDSA